MNKIKRPPLRICFYPVKTNKEKLDSLIEIAKTHIEKESKLLILTDSIEGVDYIDKLLWSHDPLSFIPHSTMQNHSSLISIAMFPTELEGFPNLLNLTAEPIIDPPSQVKIIHELEDNTSKTKSEIAKIKYDAYKAIGHHLMVQGSTKSL